MAFPTVPTSAAGRILTNNQADTSATRTFPDLSSLTKSSGDLLIAIVTGYQSAGSANAVFSSWGGGFTEFTDQMTTSGSTMAIGAAYKFSTGSETGTFTVTQASPTGHASMILMAISGAHASTVPEAGTIANGTSAAADPGALDPAGWAAEDTLWIAVGANGETSGTGSWTAMNAAPTNYTDFQGTNPTDTSTVGQTGLAVAFRQLNATSEDAGAFSTDTSNARNSALLIAVRPSSIVSLTRNNTDSVTFSESLARTSQSFLRALTDTITLSDVVTTVQPTSTTVARVSLASIPTPTTQDHHSLFFRAKKASGTGSVLLRAALYEGATNRSGNLASSALTTSLADYELSISDAAAATITDYSNLEVRFWGTSATSDTIAVSVADVWLQTPAGAGAASYTRDVTDSFTFSESLVRASQGFTRTRTDSFTFSESPAGVLALAKAITDSVTLSAGQSSQSGVIRATADSLTFSEALARVAMGMTRSTADSVTFSEALERIVAGARLLTDSATFSESLVRALTETRTTSDSISFAESLVGLSNFVRALTASISFSESLTSQVGGNARAVSDALHLAESMTAGVSLHVTPTDSLQLSDSLGAATALSKAISDALHLADSSVSQKGLSRTTSDSFTFAEALARTLHLFKSPTDALNFAEGLAVQFSGDIYPTHPRLDAIVGEIVTGGVFDETLTSGAVVEAIHSALVFAALGGTFNEAIRSADVNDAVRGALLNETSHSGDFDESLTDGDNGETSGAVLVGDRGGLFSEAQRSAVNENSTGGAVDEPSRGGDPNESSRNGDVF